MHKRIITFVILLSASGALWGQYGGIRKFSELQSLKQMLLQDTLAAFEYKCAQDFHILINEYRASKRKKPLAFSDSLWLVARNHSVYMAENGEFSHNQKKGKALFSGVSPLKRIEFAHNRGVDLHCGENIAKIGYDEGSSAALAQEAFVLWKNSEGHNKNMLDKDYKEHGTAFIWRKDEENNYGNFLVTDLFADLNSLYNEKYKDQGSPIMISENSHARNTRKGNGEKPKKFNVSFIKKELGNAFYYLKVSDSLPDQWKRSDLLSKSCLERSDAVLAKQLKNKFLNATIDVEGSASSTNKTLVKPNFIKRILGKDNHTVITVLYGFKEEHFDTDKITREVYKSWLDSLPLDKQHINYGFHIGVQKKGSTYWVCASIETGN